MDLRQMEVVLAVADEGGFSAAARRLHLVQSAVSATVRTVERDLGTTLFDRTTHRVAITPAGEAFLPAARAALRAADEVRTAVDLVSGELRGELILGVMQGVWGGLHHALADLRAAHPHVVVRLRQGPATSIPAALRDGELDLAIVALRSLRQSGLVTRLLLEEQMVVVAAADGPLGQRSRIGLADLTGHPFIDFTPGWAIRAEVDAAFRAAHQHRHTTFEVNDVVVAAELVRAELGITVVPRSVAERFGDLRIITIARHAPRWRVMAVHRRGEDSPLVAAILEHLG